MRCIVCEASKQHDLVVRVSAEPVPVLAGEWSLGHKALSCAAYLCCSFGIACVSSSSSCSKATKPPDRASHGNKKRAENKSTAIVVAASPVHVFVCVGWLGVRERARYPIIMRRGRFLRNVT